MANEDVFEINDFSMASEWERFVSDLEEILTEWNLITTLPSAKNETSNQNVFSSEPVQQQKSSTKYFQNSSHWTNKQEQIKFGKVLFCLNYHCYKDGKPLGDKKKFINNFWCEMQSFEHDWASSGHPLVRYYGLSQFLVLQPINQTMISTEDRAKHLIGSAAIALANINCEIPFFCQIGQLHQRTFMGVQHIENGYRTYFDMIQFPKVPESFQYLSDIGALFKKKLHNSFCYYSSNRESTQSSNMSLLDEAGRIQVSVRFTYLLNLWPAEYTTAGANNNSDVLVKAGLDYFRDDHHQFDLTELLLKPISITSQVSEPFKQLQLATTWPSIAEEMVVDNANHSYLQPRNAPRWSIRALYNQFDQSMVDRGQLHTVSCLSTFINLKADGDGGVRVLQYLQKDSSPTGDGTTNKENANVRTAFNRLTESNIPMPTATVTQLVSSSTGKYIHKLLQNIPANLKGKEQNDGSITGQVQSLIRMLFHAQLETKPLLEHNNLNIRSAPSGSLTWRIALILSNIYSQYPEPSSIAVVWNEIVRELRRMWVECEQLQFVHDDHDTPQDSTHHMTINYSHCLLHQKLEMLNFCIRQKSKQEGLKEAQPMADDNEEDDDEEFFDCNEADDNVDGQSPAKVEGQLEMLRNAKNEVIYLLKKPNEAIYIPKTQEMSPQTEDMLAEQMNSTLSCSTEDEPHLMAGARFHSAGLTSDMEAFKAANPGAEFEDFIRWHSPRDWIEIDGGKFGLSRRMQESNSVWKVLWARAKAVPIHRQKRLFNYTKEAEQILQSFERITVSRLVELLAPVLIKATALQLLDLRAQTLEFVKNNIGEANQKLYEENIVEFFAFDVHQLEMANMADVVKHLAVLEYRLVCFYSTVKKLILAYEAETKKDFGTFVHNKEAEIATAANKDDPNARRAKPSKPGTLAAVRTKTGGQLTREQFVVLIVKLLTDPEVEFMSTNKWSDLIVRLFQDSEQFRYEQSTSVGDRIGRSYDEDSHEGSGNGDKHRMSQTKANLPNPSGKEFIFRAAAVARPSPYSRPGPNRMYCLLSPNKDFRVASAFVEDTVFL